jgi:hypothetical protein
MRRCASGLLVAAVVGLALAFPIPVLTIAQGSNQRTVWLADGDPFTYSYVNSVYNAPVDERQVRANDRLVVTSVRSPDIRALEYFRWDTPVASVDDAYLQTAPPNSADYLRIQVTPPYRQRLASQRWAVDLAETFGDGVVLVTPQRLPALSALLGGWRP